jgi:hypothetical protein
MAGIALACLAAADEVPGVHDPAVHAGSGLKKELIAGIGEADFLKLGEQSKTLKITLVVAFNDANSWMNFNGYSHGAAVYTVPKGWTVEVTFINPSPSPHSAIVVEREMLRKVQVGEPAFKGASTPNPIRGLSTTKSIFSFIASEPGQYGIACGVPTHATAGHWVALNVSADTTLPTLKLGNAPAREAK